MFFFLHRYVIVIAAVAASTALAGSVITDKQTRQTSLLNNKQTNEVAASSNNVVYPELIPKKRMSVPEVEDVYNRGNPLESGQIKVKNAADSVKKLSVALVSYVQNYLKHLNYNEIFKGILLEGFIRVLVAVVGAAAPLIVPVDSVKSLMETLPSYSKLLASGKADHGKANDWQIEQLAEFVLDAFDKYDNGYQTL